MASASFTVTVTATAPDEKTAGALRLVGLRRFVRCNSSVLPPPINGAAPLDVATMDEAELLPYAETALQNYIRACIVADAARDADTVRAGLVAQAEGQTLSLTVAAEVGG